MTYKKYFSNNIQRYKSETEESIEMSESLTKSNTEKRVVEPFLEFLGWPLRSPLDDSSVELDYGLDDNNDTTVDYALLINDEFTVCVETYEYGEKLPDKEVVRENLESGFEWSVLTNGDTYEFYRLVGNTVKLVESVELNSMEESADFLTYMSFESLQSQRTREESEEYDRAIVDSYEIERIVESLELDLSSSLTSVTDEEIKSKVSEFEESFHEVQNVSNYFTVESAVDNFEDLRFETGDVKESDSRSSQTDTTDGDVVESNDSEQVNTSDSGNLSSDSSEGSSEDSSDSYNNSSLFSRLRG